MKNKLHLAFLLSTFLFSGSLFAQASTRHYELGTFVGTVNYAGYMTESGLGQTLEHMRAMGGITFKYNFNNIFSLGVEGGYGRLFVNDANFANIRGYEMNTELAEVQFISEINFKKFGKYFRFKRTSPFIRAGIGGAFYSPNLETFGNFKEDYIYYPDAYQSFVFSMGFGFRYRLNFNWVLNAYFVSAYSNNNNMAGFGPQENIIIPNDRYYGLRLGITYKFMGYSGK